MIVVVDASVVIKWYVDEIHTPEALHLLEKQFDLHAPDMLLPEFGNILWKKRRNDDIPESGPETILSLFQDQAITLHPHTDLLKAAVFGAIKTGQSVYDWTYLVLARSLSCKFVTADKRFYLALKDSDLKKNLVWIEDVMDIN